MHQRVPCTRGSHAPEGPMQRGSGSRADLRKDLRTNNIWELGAVQCSKASCSRPAAQTPAVGVADMVWGRSVGHDVGHGEAWCGAHEVWQGTLTDGSQSQTDAYG
eukprot:352497-Chlamydomonas_euryale.AAC.1